MGEDKKLEQGVTQTPKTPQQVKQELREQFAKKLDELCKEYQVTLDVAHQIVVKDA